MKLNISIGVLVAAQLILGLVMQLVVLSLVGIGPDSDSFIAAQAVPLVLFAVLSACLQNLWQPKLAVASVKPEHWKAVHGVAQGQALLLLGVPVSILIASVSLWVGLLFPGIPNSHEDLVTSMTRYMLAAAWLNGHSALMTTALRAKDKFLTGESVAALGLLLSLLAVWILVPRFGVEAAAWIAVARAGLVFLLMNGLTGWSRPAVVQAVGDRNSWRQMRPLLASSSLHKSGPLIDRYWSSQGPPGGMTAYGLAQTVMAASAMLFERVVSMPVSPRLARLADVGRYEEIRAAYRRCVFLITMLMIPVAIALVCILPFWKSALKAMFDMEPTLAREMWWICLLLTGYLHVAASGTIVVAGFYALNDTRTPSLILTAGFFIGIVLKSVGFVFFGLSGLAAAASAYHLLNLLALAVTLERKLESMPPK